MQITRSEASSLQPKPTPLGASLRVIYIPFLVRSRFGKSDSKFVAHEEAQRFPSLLDACIFRIVIVTDRPVLKMESSLLRSVGYQKDVVIAVKLLFRREEQISTQSLGGVQLGRRAGVHLVNQLANWL